MYFDEFVVGTEFATEPRQMTEDDVETFLNLTLLKTPIFLDDRAAKKMGHPKRILPAPLLISMAMGLCQQRGLFDHMVAVLEFDYVKFQKPSYMGDSVQVKSRVALTRPTRNPQRGLVRFNFELHNQRHESVLEMQAVYLVLRREQRESLCINKG
ncbi:MAG TPA: MaoC/PaaZ C-terminal domain-containing protein [Syntrophales bacterium]|nr:MaoC/PaaZ C-terminal domain-containing protein [Syntrophales bacterium]